MFSIVLTNNKTDESISINNFETDAYKNAPVDWNKMKYTFTRSSKYYGLVPSFTAALGYVKKAKTWIDNIFWSDGIAADISVKVLAYNPESHDFEQFISGICNFENIIIKKYQTDLEIIDTQFIQDILNKDSIDLDYQKMVDTYSTNHLLNSDWTSPSFETVKLMGLTTTGCVDGYVEAKAVYPFQYFSQLIALMTGKQGRFFSSFFGKTTDKDENGDYYTENGEGAYMMITTGRFIRGYLAGEEKSGTGTITTLTTSATITGTNTLFVTEISVGDYIKDVYGNIIGTVSIITSNTELDLTSNANFAYTDEYYKYMSPSDSSTLVMSFEKAFKTYSNIFCLGMTIVSTSTQSYVKIEKISNYYDDNVILTIDNCKDLNFKFDQDWRYNQIEAGYNKFNNNQNNNYGNGEFNNKVVYSTPTKFTDKKLSITSDVRADGTGIQLCMDNVKSSGDDTTQTQFDTELFIISCTIENSILRSKNSLNYSVQSAYIYGDNPLFNIDISPARMIKNWGALFRANLDLQSDEVMQFQKCENLTRLSTQSLSESKWVSDGVDILISDLEKPFLAGIEVNFTSPLSIDRILKIKENPYGLIKFWDDINSEYKFGWINEVSSEPIDQITNWRLTLMSSNVTPVVPDSKLIMLNGNYFEFLKGGNFLKLNQE